MAIISVLVLMIVVIGEYPIYRVFWKSCINFVIIVGLILRARCSKTNHHKAKFVRATETQSTLIKDDRLNNSIRSNNPDLIADTGKSRIWLNKIKLLLFFRFYWWLHGNQARSRSSRTRLDVQKKVCWCIWRFSLLTLIVGLCVYLAPTSQLNVPPLLSLLQSTETSNNQVDIVSWEWIKRPDNKDTEKLFFNVLSLYLCVKAKVIVNIIVSAAFSLLSSHWPSSFPNHMLFIPLHCKHFSKWIL